MKRRAMLKTMLAAPVAAHAALYAPTVATAAGPVLVGTGCIECRPDLWPGGVAPNRLPLDGNHYSVHWTDYRGMSVPYPKPTIAVNGVEIPAVIEFYAGPGGWLIANHQDAALPFPNKAHLCDCGQPEVRIVLWRGDVRAENLPPRLAVPQIIAGQEAAAKRMMRWHLMDRFAAEHPALAEKMWREQREYPDQVPAIIERKRLAWRTLTKVTL